MSSNRFEPADRAYLGLRLQHWTRAFWPMVLVIGGGVLGFRNAITESILSTQHPAVVYTIFGVWSATVILAAMALWRFEREEHLAMRLQQLTDDERLVHLEAITWKSEMRTVYDTVLKKDVPQTLEFMQQKIETELFGCEEHLLARLDLPSYLSNSLIGIGLVGTFIGLLSSLADLATLLSGLQTPTGGSSDPVAMFSDMMQKLQKPMKGMGTSFVASLYGLLGSLTMGLVIQSVRKTGNHAIMRVRELLRLIETTGNSRSDAIPDGSPEAMERMLLAIREGRRELSAGVERFSDAVARQSGLLETLSRGVALETGQIRELATLLQQLNDTSRSLAAAERRSRMPGGPWLLTGLVVALLLLAGSLATSVMAARNAEQLTRQIGRLLLVAEQQAQLPGSSAPTVVTKNRADSVYIVIEGDTLGRIASRHGVPLRAMLQANPEVDDPDALLVGQHIRVPKGTPPPVSKQ